MAVTVTVSGAYLLDDTTGIDAFVTSALGGAAGDVVATYQDLDNRKVWIICAKA